MVVFAWLRVSILIMLCWTFSKTSSLQARVCKEGSWASYYSGCILCMANDDQGLSTCQRVLSRFVRWLKNVKVRT
ncbi:hypothetical protein PVAP13_7KG004636 [Panicum virgatum]|uniref:Secreted protein n=1 Tax=Panicum virgatum TaxID=38727 RepID=A0A8T0QAA7_PANVG|nr:hypothetical protein PVAP13_7KG004636 [Panicum virgatum]